MTAMWLRAIRVAEMVSLFLFGALLLTSGTILPGDEQDRARAFTRDVEFDYLTWMLDAAAVKAQAGAAGIPGHLDRESGRIAVSDYLHLTHRIARAEDSLNRIYADPALPDKDAAASHIRSILPGLYRQQGLLAPLAEAVLQAQVAEVVFSLGLAPLGQPLPAVLYHSTDVPDALIVSPRDQIRQSANISIRAGLPIEQLAALEQRVEEGLDVSALVVPVGGVGVYPTMIMRTTDRGWLTSTIAHEWTHNYLTLHPLGLLYEHTSELRTMNETTADIVGAEVGAEVLRRYYSGVAAIRVPDLLQMSSPAAYPDPHDVDPPPFDFRAAMHTTRITADALLASGRIGDAERYMEQRRGLFVENGYFIRRLNQAYFAFYGAYADTPGGPAGQDPVGPAVRALRSRSGSLAEFVNRIAWMTSFEQLQQAVGQ
jgi:hypothetical protein